jgi:cytochrome b subunit of formate dehydrogenase
MKKIFLSKYSRQVVQYVLLFILFLYLLSGFGITEFRVIEFVSFGVLTKNIAFILHNNLIIPMAVLLVIHILQGFLGKKYYRTGV